MLHSKISVIIPVYNKEKYLDQCMESILNQSYDNFEIFMIDDGSTDSSPIKCDKWAEKDTRITVIHKENEGLSLTRNVGLDRATGDIVSFVDADDYLDPDTYLICEREMNASGANACYFGRRAVANGEVVSDVLHIPHKMVYEKSLIKKEFAKYMIGAMPDENPRNYVGVSACTVVYERAFLERSHIRFADIRQNEDSIFNMLVCRYAEKIIVLPDILYNNTVGFQSLTRSYDVNRFDIFKKGYLETVKLKDYFSECDYVQYRMDYKFMNNVCRDIQMEMRYAKENGYIQALRHVRKVCRDKMVHEVAREVVVSGAKTKRMVLINLIYRRHSFLIWAYNVLKEMRSKIRRFKNKLNFRRNK